ncbi:E3 ubiquitin-protein ligase MARCH11 [Grifola frondosa]|uniref:E3 ubiquitin-protein ligase MARCH11 n=1 Tax=Grifola frondosa TaxID=5627 RepID=A0A1C7MQC0_GRIFR|nr:E3 ubiquitin-protein ligase MARCH11 [Grifola frondosa]
MSEPAAPEGKQCRICLDGEDSELGRLIRPCLCKGSISYVHVKCLQRWRNTSPSRSAFYSCPQCGYHYHFARTRVVGIATNPVAVAAVSSVFFTILVLCSSFITTSVMSGDDPTGYSFTFYYPFEVFRDLVRATVRILIDDRILDESILRSKLDISTASHADAGPPGRRLYCTYASLYLVALLVIAVVLVGAARALYKVYQLTERLTKRLLLRAEDAILEVG